MMRLIEKNVLESHWKIQREEINFQYYQPNRSNCILNDHCWSLHIQHHLSSIGNTISPQKKYVVDPCTNGFLSLKTWDYQAAHIDYNTDSLSLITQKLEAGADGYLRAVPLGQFPFFEQSVIE